MVKLSFTTMGTPEQDAREAIEFAARFGYRGIDLRVSDFKGEVFLESSAEALGEIRSVLSGEGVELAGLLCYNLVGSGEAESWQAMTNSLVQHLEIGVALGSPSIRMFGGNPYGEVATEEFVERTAECIDAALDRVAAPVEIVLQNHVGSYTALDGMCLCDAVGRERFGLAFSPDHSVLMKEDVAEVFARVKTYSRQLYVSDVAFEGSPDGGSDHIGVLPGRGVVPLKEAYAAIGGENFGGFVSFKWEKIWLSYMEEPEVALPYFIDWWGEVLS